MDWRGNPLVSHEVIVQLIAATKTKLGLRVERALDTTTNPAGIKVTDADLAKINPRRNDFHANGTTPTAQLQPTRDTTVH